MKLIYAVPATCALVARAYKKKSLTPAGLVVATITAVAHAWHPWNLPFVLLCVFFLAGTRVTHVRCAWTRLASVAKLTHEIDQGGCQGQVDDAFRRHIWRRGPPLSYPR